MKRTTAMLAALLLMLTGCHAIEDSSVGDVVPVEVYSAPDNDYALWGDAVQSEEEATEAPTEPMLSEGMSLEDKICQLFIITPEALTGVSVATVCGDATKEALDKWPVGGLIYFSANLEDMDQAKALLSGTSSHLKQSTGIAPFLAVDEEGGLVARCADNLGTTALEPMQTYGDRADEAEAREIGVTLGMEIQKVGFNLDFAPVADVDLDPGNELGDRIFSDDPEVVAKMVAGVVEGMQGTGVAATLKHFPGLGAENGNAHEDTKIVIDRTLDQLRAEEFIPFQRGIEAGADFVMVSHQTVTGVGDDLPACLSPIVCTDLLRGELGFEGLIVTDSLQMNTISANYDSGEAAVRALEAGVDVILMPEDFEAALQGVEDAVAEGRITEERIDESVERVLKEKKKLGLMD